MNVSLTPELERLVQEKVESGMYQTASEVVRAGLRLLEQQQELHILNVEEARKKVKRGMQQIKDGQGISDVEFRTWLAERKKKREPR